jgi:hypothetical protein
MANKQSTIKKKWYPDPALVRKRIKEMGRAFEACFPNQELPNNGLGRKWARYMMRTKRLYPSPQDYVWLENWCPWMDQPERDRILGLSGHWYSTSSLGQHLEICNDIRKELRLWTMRPTDVAWEQVQSEMKDRKHRARQERRHADGVKVRRKGVAQPWKPLGMGRTKYYRLGLHLNTIVADVTNGTPESPVSIPYVVRTGAFRVPPCQDTNVVPFQSRQSQAANPAVAGPDNNMLTWHPMRTDPCNVYADTGGLGRYVIKSGASIVLKLDGEEMKRFGSQDEAKVYAQQAYESMLLADHDIEPMAMAA